MCYLSAHGIRGPGNPAWAEHFLKLASLLSSPYLGRATSHPITGHEWSNMTGRQPPAIPCDSKNVSQVLKTSLMLTYHSATMWKVFGPGWIVGSLKPYAETLVVRICSQWAESDTSPGPQSQTLWTVTLPPTFSSGACECPGLPNQHGGFITILIIRSTVIWRYFLIGWAKRLGCECCHSHPLN